MREVTTKEVAQSVASGRMIDVPRDSEKREQIVKAVLSSKEFMYNHA